MTRRSSLFVALLATAVVSACYKPAPVAHAQLRIAANGAYTVNGVASDAQHLEAAIRASEPGQGDLVLQIDVEPAADVAAVRFAVAAATSAHARVAFANGRPAGKGGGEPVE